MSEDSVRRRVREACEHTGVQRVANALELSAEATARLAGGLRVQAGTVLVAEKNLGNLDALAR
jgi:hypothetical protein